MIKMTGMVLTTALSFMLLGCGGGGGGAVQESTPPIANVKSSSPQDMVPAANDADMQALGAGNRAFAFDLYKELRATTPGNLFFSPYSISEALAMLYAGARNTSANEMQATLHFGADQTKLHAAFNATGLALAQRKNQLAWSTSSTSAGDGFELQVFNQAWGSNDTKFLSDYLDVLARNYGVGLALADFKGNPEGARQIINSTIAGQTKDRIQDLLPPDSITTDTKLVLTNAVYFKSSWLQKFDPAQTWDAVFHAPAGDRTLSTMHQVLAASYAETSDYQVVELPYLSPSVRMLLILPAAGRFDAVVQQFAESFEQIRSGLSDYDVTLAMPKFNFTATPEITPALQTLGMRAAFTPPQPVLLPSQADFSGLDGVRDLYVSAVVHKAFVAVDETGTEAAAATAIGLAGTTSSMPPNPSAKLTLDRPFIFLVYDQPTAEIIFLGQFSGPD